MAIVIYNEPSASPLSAYNNTVIEFGLNAGVPARALVFVGTYKIELAPHNGLFYCNIKELVTLLCNQNAFEDSVSVTSATNYIYPDATLYREQQVLLQVVKTNGDVEQLTKTYPYLKSVTQQVRPLYADNNSIRLLLPSANEVKQLTYFEGLPLDVALYANANQQLTITNTYTGTSVLVNVAKGVNRWFLSNGENDNQGFEADVPLYLGLNKLEISNASETITLYVDKKPVGCGPYLKWFNRSGGWSYWQCKPVYTQKFKTKSLIGLNRDFYNLEAGISGTAISGKENEVTLEVSTGFMVDYERRQVAELFTSPKVYYYHQEALQPFTVTNWKEVTVADGSYDMFNSNQKRKEFRLSITMPMEYTQTYGG